MAKRMSNRDRIARMREEIDAAAPARKSDRVVACWAIKNGAGEIVATFPYARKEAALAEAERLQREERRDFIVCPHKQAG